MFHMPILLIYFLLFCQSCLSRQSGFADRSNGKIQNVQFNPKRFFASISTQEQKPFDFFRTLVGKPKVEYSYFGHDIIEMRIIAVL